MNTKYPQKEKLKQKKEISLLFEKGKWKTCGSVRIISYENNLFENQKVGVSVSKRNYKKATDRNRLKRLLREAYRLNKEKFVSAFGSNSISMIFWISKDFPKDLKTVEHDFLKLCEDKKKK